MNLCSKCVREFGYNIMYPHLLPVYKHCGNCGDDKFSWSEKDIKEQIKIVGDV